VILDKKPFLNSNQSKIGNREKGSLPFSPPHQKWILIWVVLLLTVLLGLIVFGGYTLNFQFCQPQGGFLNFFLTPPSGFVSDGTHLQCAKVYLR
jgi:hypothetical protein